MRLFAATASPPISTGAVPSFHPDCRPSAPFELREPHRAADGSDTPCRLLVPRWAFHNPRWRAVACRKTRLTHPSRPGQSPCRTGKGPTDSLPEVPSIGSTSPFDEVDRHGKRNRLHSSRPEHPLRADRPPAWSRFPVGPHPRYLAELRVPKDPRLARQMPLANHLQPTSCHVHPTGHPDSRREDFRLAVLRAVISLPSGWDCLLFTRSRPDGAG